MRNRFPKIRNHEIRVGGGLVRHSETVAVSLCYRRASRRHVACAVHVGRHQVLLRETWQGKQKKCIWTQADSGGGDEE